MNFNRFMRRKVEQKTQHSAENKKLNLAKWLFPFFGILAIVWILIRVISKPSRATYPCMKVAFPIATSFIIYITGMIASVYFFKKAGIKLRERKLVVAFTFLLVAFVALSIGLISKQEKVSANITVTNRFDDPLGPNSPIGEAKGILPGRVVWIHNADATNANCTNVNKTDAYFNDKNTDQTVTDQMFAEGIKKISGKETFPQAWDAIFRYYNTQHGKGDVGYSSTETIFIKINCVTAYSGATTPNAEMPANAAIEFDTSPQAILSLLRQLVNEAGIPQESIYIGDPMADIWNHMYVKFKAEFPNINYVSKRNIAGRFKITASKEVGIHYSDQGTVMTDIITHNFFKEMMNANYLINVPTMKGHRWAGVTFSAKNHFGSNTTDGSYQLHKGLMNPDNSGMRYGYNLYRVFVDLMGSKYLGEKTLLYFIDGLWSTSYEHQKPQKFQTAPFNNDFCSSFLFSLDPVAIESVGLDIMQKEFSVEDLSAKPPRYAYVMWDGVDDYLHQAASSDWWPDDIVYDPDNSGTPLSSLGVHEHWNNTTDMKYSRNMGTGQGIELIHIEQKAGNGLQTLSSKNEFQVSCYPNIVIDKTTVNITGKSTGKIELVLYDASGKKQKLETVKKTSATINHSMDLYGLKPGIYILEATIDGKHSQSRLVKN